MKARLLLRGALEFPSTSNNYGGMQYLALPLNSWWKKQRLIRRNHGQIRTLDSELFGSQQDPIGLLSQTLAFTDGQAWRVSQSYAHW